MTALVGDIDPRPCAHQSDERGRRLDRRHHALPRRDVHEHSAPMVGDGHVYLDAGGDPNAFFCHQGQLTLTVADWPRSFFKWRASVRVFWRIAKASTIGKTVKFSEQSSPAPHQP